MNTEYTVVGSIGALHPGEILLEYLDSHGWSQRDLARRAGITPKTVSEICHGKAPITPPTSLALEMVFNRPAHFWLNLQQQYDEVNVREAFFKSTPLARLRARRFRSGNSNPWG